MAKKRKQTLQEEISEDVAKYETSTAFNSHTAAFLAYETIKTAAPTRHDDGVDYTACHSIKCVACRPAPNNRHVTIAVGEVGLHCCCAASGPLSTLARDSLQAAELTGTAVVKVVIGTAWVAG